MRCARRSPGYSMVSQAANMPMMQTRYLILASLATGIAILVAAAIWLTRY